MNTNDAISKKRDEYAHDLFEQLQDKCKTLEEAEQVGIFTDRTLREMATTFPRTIEAFAQIRWGQSYRKWKNMPMTFCRLSVRTAKNRALIKVPLYCISEVF